MVSPGAYGFAHEIGSTPSKYGDITIMSAIRGRTPGDIERRLGFHKGRLVDGYCVLLLTETVTATDFKWGDRTRYSGGNQAVEVHFGSALDEDQWFAVPRIDIVRGNNLVRNQNDQLADAAIAELFRQSTHRINDGVAKAEIVKVIPNIPHSGDMPQHLQYPDAEAGNIPQWTLVRPKTMKCIAQVAGGGVYTS